MNERARTVAARLTLIAATFAAVMGYNFTQNRAFVVLPFLSSIVLVVLVLMRPKDVDTSDTASIMKKRRRGMIQLMISCAMITGFIIYRSIVGDWGMVIGFAVMLASLLPIAILAILYYERAPVERRERRTREEPSGCEELRYAGRLYGEEELSADRTAGGDHGDAPDSSD